MHTLKVLGAHRKTNGDGYEDGSLYQRCGLVHLANSYQEWSLQDDVGGVLEVLLEGLHPLRAHRAVDHPVVGRRSERYEFREPESEG